MARETRIGLLAGLFLIVMFGLVLTELTGDRKTVPAPGDAVNDTARIAALPASEDTSPAVPAPGEVVARVGPPPSQAARSAVAALPVQAPAAVAPGAAAPVQIAVAAPAQDSTAPPAPTPALLSAVETLPAPAGSEELTASLKTIAAKDAASPASAETNAAGPNAAEKTYTVAPKDTLRKIAKTVYGADNEKEYRRIFEANKGKLKSESVLSVGQVLVIPPLPGQARIAQPQAHQGGVRQVDMEQLQKELASADASHGKTNGAVGGTGQTSPKTPGKVGRVYYVTAGDNLAKIARKTMGNDRKATVMRLYNANKDRLASPERLAIGMKLEIPD